MRMRYAIGFFAAIALFAMAGLIVIYTGAYNVAATEPHAKISRWALDTTFHNSVSARSDDEAAQLELIEAADLRTGFQEFQEYCVHCHGAPGVEPAGWVSGMTPHPPELSRVADEWSPDEIFWIVKHGVKMSGMPPFGDTESDEAIRNIAAFVNRLDDMTPQQYRRLQQRWGGGEGHHGGSGSHSQAQDAQ